MEMFYLILEFSFLLFYIFAAPQSIKGTLKCSFSDCPSSFYQLLLGLAVFQIFNYRLNFS